LSYMVHPLTMLPYCGNKPVTIADIFDPEQVEAEPAEDHRLNPEDLGVKGLALTEKGVETFLEAQPNGWANELQAWLDPTKYKTEYAPIILCKKGEVEYKRLAKPGVYWVDHDDKPRDIFDRQRVNLARKQTDAGMRDLERKQAALEMWEDGEGPEGKRLMEVAFKTGDEWKPYTACTRFAIGRSLPFSGPCS